MSNSTYDIELDITDAYQYNPSSLTSSISSSQTMVIDNQPSTHQSPAMTVPSINHGPPPIHIATVPDLQVTVLWVNSASQRVMEGSTIQIGEVGETYTVMGILRRSPRNRTLLCISRSGHAIGLVAGPEHIELTWNETIKRCLVVTFCSCLLL